MTRLALLLALAALVAACGNKPRQPDWLINADGAQDRYERAYLSGNNRVAESELRRLRTELASTANPALVARGELTRCAVEVASLEFNTCPGFAPLRPDASDTERAYADFLAGALAPENAKLLPDQYRGVPGATGAAALKDIKDPLSRLVAAGVMLRTGRADAAVLQAATETASGQGWRRAVLAWLAAQVVQAEKAGATEEAQRLRRRMALAAQDR